MHKVGKDTKNTGFYSAKNIGENDGSLSAVYKLDELSTVFEFNDNPITFIKIDVEGSELDVVTGSEKTLAVHKPCLEVEFNRNTISEEDYKQIFVILSGLGYRCFAIDEFDKLNSIEHFIELYYIHENEINQMAVAESLMHLVRQL